MPPTSLGRCSLLPRHLRLLSAGGGPGSSSSKADSSVRSASTAAGLITKLIPDKEFKTHAELHKYSIEHPNEFWGSVGRNKLKWVKDFETVSECDMEKGEFKWFKEGKLNASVNCVDRHAETDPERVALIWERDEPGTEVRITYGELYGMVNKQANALLRFGVKANDVVAIYMPVSPMAVAAMLACARIGAVHNVIFAGFSAEAIASRVKDAGTVAVITADEAVRGGKAIPLKSTMDEALSMPGVRDTVKTVFVYRRTGNPTVTFGDNEHDLEVIMAGESIECPPEVRNAEDELFLLYTSGSTGKPKGLAHSTAGYLAYAGLTHRVAFNYQPGDIFGCVADIGWITGHSYVVYGPLVNGGTTVLFESTPTYPDPGRYWETVERLRITQFYGAPTAIRLLLRFGDEHVTKYDRSTLKTLGSVGEPLNIEAWEWYNRVVGGGRCDVVDTWWQTETGGICLAPRPSAKGAEIIPGKPMRPMFGMDPVLMDEHGKEITGNGVNGALCLRTPWPGIARTVHGDHKRFIETYFGCYPGFYFTGDGANRDEKGYYKITGRMDDVINVTGHRLGTAEVECALAEHPAVAESAVVGFPHPVKGEGVYAYVILKENIHTPEADLEKELKALVKKKISGFAVPEFLQFNHGLPKTRSGKIMRRILRKVAAGESMKDLGDVSTLADPSVVEEIMEKHKKFAGKEL